MNSKVLSLLARLPKQTSFSTARKPSVVRGIGDGVLATIPMTAFMWAAKMALPAIAPTPSGLAARLQRLPPSAAGAKLLRILDVKPDNKARTGLGMLGHFAIGGAAGGAFALLSRDRFLKQPRPLSVQCAIGAGFGVLVWASGYLGVLPALSLVERPSDAPRGHTAIMIGAHMIFGAALAALYGPPQTKIVAVPEPKVGLASDGYYQSVTVS